MTDKQKTLDTAKKDLVESTKIKVEIAGKVDKLIEIAMRVLSQEFHQLRIEYPRSIPPVVVGLITDIQDDVHKRQAHLNILNTRWVDVVNEGERK